MAESEIENRKSKLESEWIGGLRAVLEALETRSECALEVRLSRIVERRAGKAIALAAKKAGVKLRVVDRRNIDSILPATKHQGVALRQSPIRYADLYVILGSEALPRVLAVLDELVDPRNLGAILRSAWAFDVGAVVVPRHRSVGLTPGAIKSAAGGAEHIPVCRVRNVGDALAAMKESGYWVFGAAATGDVLLEEIDPPEHVALVLGAEGRGLRPSTKKACDVIVRIPMQPEAGSLNVGVAAGILFYHLYLIGGR